MHTAQWLSFTFLSFSMEINAFQENAYSQQVTSGFLHRPELDTNNFLRVSRIIDQK